MREGDMFDSELGWCTVDVDECDNGLGPCGTDVTAVSCDNTDGSYNCICVSGYDFTDGMCRGNMQLIVLLTLLSFSLLGRFLDSPVWAPGL